MRKRCNVYNLSLSLLILLYGLSQASTPLSVSDVRTSQRAGTNLMDVYYDISGGTPPYKVSLQVSQDGGMTWSLPVTNVSGNVGSGVTAGTNRVITWNAGADWNGSVSSGVKFQVTASDTPPVPAGFALIPAGSFLMGDQSSPLVGCSNELPVHRVQVSAFYMANYLVTKEDWDAVRAWGLTHGYTDLAAGSSKGENHPVHLISWFDAVKWCNARSQKEGLAPCYTKSGVIYQVSVSYDVVCNWSANGYRLPTEAEWEKAARGGLSGKLFPWGDTISHTNANFCNDGHESYQMGDMGYHPMYKTGAFPYTSPVGRFAVNSYGLCDMSGNLWQWCWDLFGDYTADSQTDPRGPALGQLSVGRGGNWYCGANYSRVSYRGFSAPFYKGISIWFRIARSAIPETARSEQNGK